MTSPVLVVGHDAAWGGWAWAISLGSRVYSTHRVDLSGRAWRWRDLVAELALLDAEVERIRETVGIRLPRLTVVEKAPDVYRGRGNQAAIGYGIGKIVGAILLDATDPLDRYPWEIEVREWRSWWGIRGNRERVKASAVALATRLGHGAELDAYSTGADDVAEAILISLGAGLRANLGPKGPKGWTAWTAP